MLRRFSIKSFKFFAAGKGLSFQTGRYLFESMLVGAVTGLVVVGFRFLIEYGNLAVESLKREDRRGLNSDCDFNAKAAMRATEIFVTARRWRACDEIDFGRGNCKQESEEQSGIIQDLLGQSNDWSRTCFVEFPAGDVVSMQAVSRRAASNKSTANIANFALNEKKRMEEGKGDGGVWSWVVRLLLPMIGAVAGYWTVKRFASVVITRGTDSAIWAYHKNDGYIAGETIPIKSIASVMTVASGGSAGYEGPVTLIGAAVGSVIGRWMNLTIRARRILMAAGLAGGIAALFQAPLAGAIFGFEIFYSSSDVEYETMLPSFIASAFSYTVYAYFFGWDSLFRMPPEYMYDSGLRLLPYLVLAIVIVFGVRFYISFFRSTEASFKRMRLPGAIKVAIGGLIAGIIGVFFPSVAGTSYSVIQMNLDEHSLPLMGCLAFFLMKMVATAFTVGSGGSGGVFAPALVCGSSLGSAVGLFFAAVLPKSLGIHPASFALVGMAGFLASAVRIPMTAIVIVAEISGNHHLLLPAMWVCGIAFWLNNGWSLYRSQPHKRL